MKINQPEIRGGYTLGLVDYLMGALSGVHWVTFDISGGILFRWFLLGRNSRKTSISTEGLRSYRQGSLLLVSSGGLSQSSLSLQ